jgi:TatD DNase family protein
MWIDTHCHLDAPEFDADRDAVVARARAAGVSMIVIPAGHVDHFAGTRDAAHRYGFAYALGIHPLCVAASREQDIATLRAAAQAALDDERFVAIGEIGIDFFEPGLDRNRQEWFYKEQLRVARDFELPVIVHVRRSADALLKYLNRIPVRGGIVHAFNGSEDQAERLRAHDMKLGFGGAMTYDGSLRIRRFAATLPDDAWVLETDAPDIPTQWQRKASDRPRNEPGEIPRIAGVMAQLRGTGLEALAEHNRRNARAALPRLAALLDKHSG